MERVIPTNKWLIQKTLKCQLSPLHVLRYERHICRPWLDELGTQKTQVTINRDLYWCIWISNAQQKQWSETWLRCVKLRVTCGAHTAWNNQSTVIYLLETELCDKLQGSCASTLWIKNTQYRGASNYWDNYYSMSSTTFRFSQVFLSSSIFLATQTLLSQFPLQSRKLAFTPVRAGVN